MLQLGTSSWKKFQTYMIICKVLPRTWPRQWHCYYLPCLHWVSQHNTTNSNYCHIALGSHVKQSYCLSPWHVHEKNCQCCVQLQSFSWTHGLWQWLLVLATLGDTKQIEAIIAYVTMLKVVNARTLNRANRSTVADAFKNPNILTWEISFSLIEHVDQSKVLQWFVLRSIL